MTTWFLKFSSTSQQSCGFQERLCCLADRNIMFYSYPLFFPFVSAVPVIGRTAGGGRQDPRCLMCSTTGRWAEMCFQNGGSWCVFLLCELVIGRKIGRYVRNASYPAFYNASCMLVIFSVNYLSEWKFFPVFQLCAAHISTTPPKRAFPAMCLQGLGTECTECSVHVKTQRSVEEALIPFEQI